MKPLSRTIRTRLTNLAVLCLLFATGTATGQTVTLTPDAVVNGVEAFSGDQYHQRLDITLGGTALAATRAFTITVPPELTVVVPALLPVPPNCG